MKEIIRSKYSGFFGVGLLLTIICAWFSAGYYNCDEHFQVLEFCNYKLGNTSADNLPWEFREKVRGTFLPCIAYFFAKILSLIGAHNPFTLTFLLRLLTGLTAWFITCKFCLLLASKFSTVKGEKLFVLMSLFLWFVPFLNVRFTFENVSGILFLYGMFSILKNTDKNSGPISNYLIAGLLFGFSFFIRPQMFFAIIGFIAWLLFINKVKWNYFSILCLSGVAAIGINVLIDYWFYGILEFTPFNYFYSNIIQHKAAGFGVNEWWFYFHEFIRQSFSPLGILLLLMFFAGIFNNLKDPFAWTIIPFLALHLLILHKEFRFLFPMTFVFIYICAKGFDYFLGKAFYQKIHNYIFAVLIIITVPLLLIRSLTPANVEVNYYKFLNQDIAPNESIIFCQHNDYYCTILGGRAAFYNNPNITTVSVDNVSQINDYLKNNKLISSLFLCRTGGEDSLNFAGYETRMIYSYLPASILKYDTKNWLASLLTGEPGVPIWHIYRFTRID